MIRSITEINLNKIKSKRKLLGSLVCEQKVTLKHYYEYIKYLCKTDSQLFSLLFLSHYNSYAHNKFHLEAFDQIDLNMQKIAIAASRGLAKSSLYSLTSVLHDILYRKEKFILLLSNTESQAISHAKNIIYELTNNDLIISVFSNLLPSKKTSALDFVTTTNIRFSSRGANSSLRGLRHGEYRPTKIVLDDVEDAEVVENEITRVKFEEIWFKKEVMPLGNPETKIWMIGTVLHEDSLLKHMQKNPSFLEKTYKTVISWDTSPSLWQNWKHIYTDKDNPNYLSDSNQYFEQNKEKMLENSEVIWPEKENYLDIQKKIVEIGRASFLQEFQMESIDKSKCLFTDFHYFTFEKVQNEDYIVTHHGHKIPVLSCDVYMSVDPTAGSKSRLGDTTSIVLAYVNVTERSAAKRLFVFADWTRPAKPSEWIEKIYMLSEQFSVKKITIEENLYRNFLKENMVRVRDDMIKSGKISQNCIPLVKTVIASQNKEKRIMELEPKVNNGLIQFQKTALSQEFWSQMENYTFSGKGKDDVPDSLHILWGSVSSFSGASVSDRFQNRHMGGY